MAAAVAVVVSASEKKRISKILELLDEHYAADGKCYLNHETPWQLLFATILSAQCTDARVNMVTEELYKKYDSVEKFANADYEELCNDIHSTGFYRNKAANIIACAKKLMELYNGEVPSKLEDLILLDGVGRKTANVIRGNIFNEPSIVVDTHVKRISKKLGFTESDDPVKIEFELMDKLPKDHWIAYNIQIIAHGRSICTARNPQCGECFLQKYCPNAKAESKSEAKAKTDTKVENKIKTETEL